MLTLKLDRVRSLLCLGAHSDDIELGCAGALVHLAETNPGIAVHAVVFSGERRRADEAQASFDSLLPGVAKKRLDLHAFPDTCFPFAGREIKDAFRRLQRDAQPDLIFTHRTADAHQDHRLIGELTWNAFRDHLILEYEIAKYDADLTPPNCYLPLDASTARRKVEHLTQHFSSQQGKPWYDAAAFESLMRLRGLECNAPDGFAEAFHARKLCLVAR